MHIGKWALKVNDKIQIIKKLKLHFLQNKQSLKLIHSLIQKLNETLYLVAQSFSLISIQIVKSVNNLLFLFLGKRTKLVICTFNNNH